MPLDAQDIEVIRGLIREERIGNWSAENPPPDLVYQKGGLYMSPSTGMRFVKAGGGTLLWINQPPPAAAEPPATPLPGV